MSASAGVGQIDGDLGVLDPPRCFSSCACGARQTSFALAFLIATFGRASEIGVAGVQE